MDSFCGNCAARRAEASNFCASCGQAFGADQPSQDANRNGAKAEPNSQSEVGLDRAKDLKTWANSVSLGLVLSQIISFRHGAYGRLTYQEIGDEVTIVILALLAALGVFVYLKRTSHRSMLITFGIIAALTGLGVVMNISDGAYSLYNWADWSSEVLVFWVVFSLWMLVSLTKKE